MRNVVVAVAAVVEFVVAIVTVSGKENRLVGNWLHHSRRIHICIFRTKENIISHVKNNII